MLTLHINFLNITFFFERDVKVFGNNFKICSRLETKKLVINMG